MQIAGFGDETFDLGLEVARMLPTLQTGRPGESGPGPTPAQHIRGHPMLPALLNLLQNLLLPLLIGVIAAGGLVACLVGRRPRHAARRHAGAAARAPAEAVARPTSPAVVATAAVDQAVTAAAARTVPPRTPPPSPAPCLPLRADLLLVDDSAVVRAKLRRLFEPAGYSITQAKDGAEALALLERGRYGVMVTDLEMPRLDGVGLIRATQTMPACAGMPILAITGHDDLQSQLSQLQAVTGIYRKPWIDDDLLGHVQVLAPPSLSVDLIAEEA
jgi:CheY-like chemotaxis protein